MRKNASACNCCYPTDNFVPFAFPIFGEYNDYGGIKNATTLEENKNHLLNMEFIYENSDDEKIPFRRYDDFDDFVNNVLCTHQGAYMKLEEVSYLHPDGIAEINFMMIHYDLYKSIINEMFSRIPYDKDESYGNLLIKKFKKIVSKYRKNCESLDNALAKTPNDEKTIKTNQIMKEYEIINVAHEIFDRGIMLNTEKWKYFATRLVEDNSNEDDIIRNLVDLNMLTSALSALRKGYLYDSGCGSQSQETKMHVILAKFILNHVKNQAQRDKNINIDGEEETIFFWEK